VEQHYWRGEDKRGLAGYKKRGTFRRPYFNVAADLIALVSGGDTPSAPIERRTSQGEGTT